MITKGMWVRKGDTVCNENEVMYKPAKNFNMITPSQELDDNAKAISAVPELIQALQSVHRELRKSGWDMTLINAALKKAGV